MKTKRLLAALCALALCAGTAGIIPNRPDAILTASAEVVEDKEITLDGNQIGAKFEILESWNSKELKYEYKPMADTIMLYSSALDNNGEMTLIDKIPAYEMPNATNYGSENTRGYNVVEKSYEYDDKYTYLVFVASNSYFKGGYVVSTQPRHDEMGRSVRRLFRRRRNLL